VSRKRAVIRSRGAEEPQPAVQETRAEAQGLRGWRFGEEAEDSRELEFVV